MVQFANKREEERRAEVTSPSEKQNGQASSRDFLSRFLGALEKDPSIPTWQVPLALLPPSPPPLPKRVTLEAPDSHIHSHAQREMW